MENEQAPESLFKYTTFDSAIKTISNSTLYWSSVNQFNDPFEYKFRFFTNGNENAVTARFLAATFIKDPNAIRIFNENPELQTLRIKYLDGSIRFSDIELFVNNLLLTKKFNIPNSKPQVAMGVYKKIFLESISLQIKGILDDKTGVLCLTDDSDERSSRLMWSHYADCHKGVRIKLNTKYIESISDLIKSGIRKVRYQEDFPLIEYDDYLGFAADMFPESTRNLVNKMIFTKSDEWSYENEYRSVIPINGTSRIINVNQRAFDSIYIGLKMSPEQQDQLISTAKRHMPGMKIFKAEQENHSYKLTYEEVRA